MRLTNKSEYALLAMVYLARQPAGEYISMEQIADAQHIPPRFLEQILLALVRARYLLSARGRSGGYILARPAREISLAELIRLFDGALAPTDSVSHYFYESTPIEQEEKLLETFRQIRDLVAERLESTTLADVT